MRDLDLLKKEGEFVDENSKNVVIFDGAFRVVEFENGKLGYAALDSFGCGRIKQWFADEHLKGYTLYWCRYGIYMALED